MIYEYIFSTPANLEQEIQRFLEYSFSSHNVICHKPYDAKPSLQNVGNNQDIYGRSVPAYNWVSPGREKKKATNRTTRSPTPPKPLPLT